MTTTNWFQARAALRARLQTVSGLPTIAYEGQDRAPGDAGTAWVREKLRPVDSRLISFGGDGAPDGWVRDEALYLIDVFYPIGSGLKAIEDMADAVAAAFRPGTNLAINGGVAYAMCQRASRAEMQPEADWLMIPVTISILVPRPNA